MAYNNKNYVKRIEKIRQVYDCVKERDKPDSFIVKNVFPKHGINISYSGWMFIKHYGKPERADTKQLAMFD